MTNANQEKAPVDWLMPKRAEPVVKKKKTRTIYELVSEAIYWAERNGARLTPSPSPLRQEKEYKAWVKAKGYYAIIFSHVWAKKFWGDAKYCTCQNVKHEGKCWEYHLTQQLLYRVRGRYAPLKYIARFGLGYYLTTHNTTPPRRK